MTKRIYHYHIKVVFEKTRQECKQGNYYSKYPNSSYFEDSFHFFGGFLLLIASRSRKYNDGSILSNANHSITKQLNKGLLYYYALAKTFPIIKKISITLKQSGKNDIIYSEASSFIQPLMTDKNIGKSYLDAKKMQNILFDNSDKAKALRIAISYWMKGMASTNTQYQFLHFWQAYNAIFRYESDSIKDFDGLTSMRKLVQQNHLRFVNSLNEVNLLVQKDLLKKLRWSKLFLHEYPRETAKGKKFHDFILRYTDKTIMHIFLNHYKVREKSLDNALLTKVQNHMNSNLGTDNLIEIPLLLCNKYSYFVRNMIFHGEVQEYSFKIKTDQIDEEFDILNSMFKLYLLDLIQNHSILRI